MQINSQNRPWTKKVGHRNTPEPYYQTGQWKNLRSAHRNGYSTMEDGSILSNLYCITCYRDKKGKILGSHCDHIIARKDGGKDELSNLQTLCDHHHASKSAIEGNNRRRKK